LIAAFDATVLLYLFDAGANSPVDPSTGESVTHCKDRVAGLIASIQQSRSKIIIPAPALAEVLVYGDVAAPEWLRILGSTKHIKIAPFDERAAVEYAAMEQARLVVGSKPSSTRAKAKFDAQIVAIARVEQAQIIYSDDDDIKRLAGDGMTVHGIASLPVPDELAQMPLFDPDREVDT
jgi:predicted nucleic acid-binding protein